jgi:hypothetical protein
VLVVVHSFYGRARGSYAVAAAPSLTAWSCLKERT